MPEPDRGRSSAAGTTAADPGDGLRRSVRLFRSFLHEQSDPNAFYGLIADDAVRLMRPHLTFRDSLIADFGGGPGYYSQAFRAEGARTVLVDADLDEIQLHGRRPSGAVVGLAEQSPLADGCVDVAFSSNLLEHVPDLARRPTRSCGWSALAGSWCCRTRSGWGPWGGHETSPWHYLGGHRAARRYERRTGAHPRTGSASRCSPPRVATVSPGSRAGPTSRCSTSGPATCRRPAGRCSGCRDCARSRPGTSWMVLRAVGRRAPDAASSVVNTRVTCC